MHGAGGVCGPGLGGAAWLDANDKRSRCRALGGFCVAGCAVGSLLAFSNMYFALQTGWITTGSLQSALLGCVWCGLWLVTVAATMTDTRRSSARVAAAHCTVV
jgi:hypothetical protein